MAELQRFVRLTYPDGTTIVSRPADADNLIDDAATAGPFKLVEILLTEAEFELIQDL